MKTMTIDELSGALHETFVGITNNNKPIAIKCGNGKAVILLSLDECQSIAETMHLLSSPATAQEIRQSVIDIKQGRGIVIDIDDL